uniref:Tail tape measure protein n=1 Tax=viral metagenome TaxID=1070528 RepID=A0A6M3KXV1_9ZZZZ
MSEVVARGIIEIDVDSSKAQRDMNNLKNVAHVQSRLISKEFVRGFYIMAESATKMASQVSAAMKLITIPAIGFGTLAVKKTLSAWTETAIEARIKFNELKASINDSMVRIGGYITQSKVFGRTMFEWMDAFSKLLQHVTQDQIQRMVNLISKFVVTLGALKGALMALQFSAGFVRSLYLLQGVGLSGGTGGALQAAGGLAQIAGAGAMGAPAIMKNLSSLGSLGAMATATKLTQDKFKTFADLQKWAKAPGPHIIPASSVGELTQAWHAREQAVATATAAAAAKASTLMGKLSILLKGVGKIATIFTLVLFALEGVTGFFKGLLGWGKDMSALAASWNVLKGTLGVGAASLNVATAGFGAFMESLGGLVRAVATWDADAFFSSLEEASKKIMLARDKLGEALLKLWNPKLWKAGQEGAAAIAEGERGEDVGLGPEYMDELNREIAELDREMDAAAIRAEKLRHSMEHLFDPLEEETKRLENQLDIERISKDVERKEKELRADDEEIFNKAYEARRRLRESEERQWRSYSGQYMGSADVVKFAQRVETETQNRQLEYQRQMQDIEREELKEFQKNNAELQELNEKFARFLRYTELGLPANELAAGVGL